MCCLAHDTMASPSSIEKEHDDMMISPSLVEEGHDLKTHQLHMWTNAHCDGMERTHSIDLESYENC